MPRPSKTTRRSKKPKEKSSANEAPATHLSFARRWLERWGGRVAENRLETDRLPPELEGLERVKNCALEVATSFGPSSLEGRGWGGLCRSADIRGDVCRLRLHPAIDRDGAAERLRRVGGAPGGAGSSPGSLGELSVAVIHLRVAYQWYSEEEELLGFAYEMDTGRRLSEDFVQAFVDRPLRGEALRPDEGEAFDFTAFRSCLDRAWKSAEGHSRRRILAVEEALDLERDRRRERLETYYEGLKKEQEEEKQSVYFHLYYFEREEKIKQRMERCRREKEAALADDKGLFDVTGEIRLASVCLLKLPVHRFVQGEATWDVEAVTGTLVGKPTG